MFINTGSNTRRRQSNKLTSRRSDLSEIAAMRCHSGTMRVRFFRPLFIPNPKPRDGCTPTLPSMSERMDMVFLDLRGKRFQLERARLLDLPESVLL